MCFVCTSQDLVAKASVSSADCNKLPIKRMRAEGWGGGEKSSEKQEQIKDICLVYSAW